MAHQHRLPRTRPHPSASGTPPTSVREVPGQPARVSPSGPPRDTRRPGWHGRLRGPASHTDAVPSGRPIAAARPHRSSGPGCSRWSGREGGSAPAVRTQTTALDREFLMAEKNGRGSATAKEANTKADEEGEGNPRRSSARRATRSPDRTDGRPVAGSTGDPAAERRPRGVAQGRRQPSRWVRSQDEPSVVAGLHGGAVEPLVVAGRGAP